MKFTSEKSDFERDLVRRLDFFFFLSPKMNINIIGKNYYRCLVCPFSIFLA